MEVDRVGRSRRPPAQRRTTIALFGLAPTHVLNLKRNFAMNKAVGFAVGALALPLLALAADAPGPTDAQIAGIVVTANQVDIDAGKVAKSKAQNVDVKAFGEQMIADHTGVNKTAQALVTKLKVSP